MPRGGNRPVRADRPVRPPGEAAAQGIAAATRDGITCETVAWTAIEGCARDLGVSPPSAR
jgi:LDH2 family malate/lactate/ureidoglycolate dehydrogenase